MRFLTAAQTADLLSINITTLTNLVNSGKIPYIDNQTGSGYKFNSYAVENWLLKGLSPMNDEKYLERLKKRINEKYPKQIKLLKKYNEQFKEPLKPKGYNLVKVPNKKLGWVYYVRYIVKGKLVYSRWCTHTNNEQAAIQYAIENRDRLLEKYYSKKEKKKTVSFYSIFKNYYSENSPYLQASIKRGRVLSEDSRISYNNFMNRQFIPYLKKQGVKEIEQINTPLLARFQNYLLSDKNKNGRKISGVKPQTIAHYISYISMIFDHLLIEGYIKTNPCASLTALRVSNNNQIIRGCYDINKLKGVFNKKWKNELSYLLSLIMYTTNMRNIEIEKMQVKDIFMIDKIHFINIDESKTRNGIRIAPLHDFVYRKIMSYIRKNKLTENDYIFKLPNCKKLGSKRYNAAYMELAGYMGYSAERLKKENITFYSGRHFWKTLMNSENLGDVEEFFMGHKISADVAKRYNHKDKQGKKKLLEKARKVFQILDKYIFINN